MCVSRVGRRWRVWTGVLLSLGHAVFSAETPAPESSPATPLAVTNLAQVRRLAAENVPASYAIRLEGDVWWENAGRGRLVLKDATAAEELELTPTHWGIRTGDHVLLTGNGTIARNGAALKLGARGAAVDNDGEHSMTEKSGAVYLTAGLNPIQLDWFNGVEKHGLEVEFEGPSIPRQKIPDTVLYRSPSERGLNYQCYDVAGESLPDFSSLPVLKSGSVTNFDVEVIPRVEHIGVRFTGWLEVPRDGLYVFHTTSDDGSRLSVGGPSLDLAVTGRSMLPEPRRLGIGQKLPEPPSGSWVEVEGKVTMARRERDEMRLELSGVNGRLRVEVSDATSFPTGIVMNARIRAVGFCEAATTPDGQEVPGVLLVPSAREINGVASPAEIVESAGPGTNALPWLTSAAEVHRLKREQAERSYPLRIRGVVTSVLPEREAFVIEDATRGLYVEDHSPTRSGPPQIGEFLEVEGVSDPSLFAPIAHAEKVLHLGAGRLPDPVVPTWDQLINGSLDAQYVEVQGIVTAGGTNEVTFRTRGGVITVRLRLNGRGDEDLAAYENALVRLRGCLLANWDYATHQVEVGSIRMYDADLLVDQPAPGDLFSSPSKTPAELLLFDPQAGEFERVKVSGQIVYAGEPEYFMMQGDSGLRFIAKKPVAVRAGDLVDVVGFPELLGNGSPVLRDGVVRVTGHAELPPARALLPDDLMRAGYDSTRVRIDGLLAGVRRTRTDQVLEIVAGVRTFVARLTDANLAEEPPALGSKLELTGVYAAQGGNRAVGQDVTSFELLLNSPADIRVLAHPPWWTPQRLLVIVGALACVLAATVLWITQLHRQVEKRTAELGEQIQERQRVEHQRAMEEERSRIAQDLHDELGSGITEISMLAARMKAGSSPGDKTHRHLDQVGDKAREMVTALDEIVWAMNPRHNSLASLVSYFSLYADRFLGLANIAWRLEPPSAQADVVLNSRHRHQLFLAFKEALNNVVRHAEATEVRLSIRVERDLLRLAIADNGKGLGAGARTEEMDGVANMRARVENLGGRFEMHSEPGRGTEVLLSLPAH